CRTTSFPEGPVTTSASSGGIRSRAITGWRASTIMPRSGGSHCRGRRWCSRQRRRGTSAHRQRSASTPTTCCAPPATPTRRSPFFAPARSSVDPRDEKESRVSTKYEAIRYDVDAVATVTLNRPDVHNAMNEVMRRELTACFDGLAVDDVVKVVIVTGAGGRAFSAGADIREFVAPLVPVQFREQRRRVDFRQAMDRCPQPIVAAMNGFAFGGGLELALACDIRI